MEKIQVFLDTDVVISALLSQKGASFIILNHSDILKFIFTTGHKEIKEVCKRLKIDFKKFQFLQSKIKTIPLKLTKKELLIKYKQFVLDNQDSHIIAGAHKAKTKFQLTHNLKHYKINLIKSKLGILVLKPGFFLQYLRSIGQF